MILLRLLCEMMFQPESLNADKNHQLLLYTIQSVCAPLLIHFKYTHLSKHAPFMCQSASAPYLLVHTALRYAAPLPHYHSVITAATGGLLAKKASLSCSFSQQAPPPVLLQHLLPLLLAFAKTTVNQAKQGWCKSVKMCLPIAETAGRRSLMGEKTQALN